MIKLQKQRCKIVKSLMHIPLVFGLCFYSNSLTASPIATSDFSDTVKSVTKNGVILFKENGDKFYRLWGIEPHSDKYRDFLVGKRLRCSIAGEVSVHWGGFLTRRTSVVCQLNAYETPQVGELASYLLNNGYATEVCSETSNLFGTCE